MNDNFINYIVIGILLGIFILLLLLLKNNNVNNFRGGNTNDDIKDTAQFTESQKNPINQSKIEIESKNNLSEVEPVTENDKTNKSENLEKQKIDLLEYQIKEENNKLERVMNELEAERKQKSFQDVIDDIHNNELPDKKMIDKRGNKILQNRAFVYLEKENEEEKIKEEEKLRLAEEQQSRLVNPAWKDLCEENYEQKKKKNLEQYEELKLNLDNETSAFEPFNENDFDELGKFNC